MSIVQVTDHGQGKGKTYIDDDCVVKTEKEVRQILDKCQEIRKKAFLQIYLSESFENNPNHFPL